MYRSRVVLPEDEVVDEYEFLEDAIFDIQNWWNEEDGDQVFIVEQEKEGVKSFVCTLFRHSADPEICVTVFPDGLVRYHRCHYVEGEDGIVPTIITPIEL